MNSFRELRVYQRSYRAAVEMYKLVRKYPKEELFGLTSQIKRATTSIPLNIAEGYGKRENPNEFKRFMLMAIGSCDEIRVLIDLSRELGFMDKEEHDLYEKEYEEIGKMLTVLRRNWR